MIKNITINKIRLDAGMFLSNWEASKKEIKLPVKPMYALLKLKKSFESELGKVDDFLSFVCDKHDGTRLENGGFQIPEEHRAAALEELEEFGFTEVEFEYTPIQINEDDSIPATILESIFDYVDIE